jgi:arachidonate 5-lipoxygenase
MVLFYLTPSQELLPVAIQLGQKPGNDCPIWTPADSGIYYTSLSTDTYSLFCLAEDWLWAKMWVGSVIGQASQLFYHLPMCHFAMEVFAVALLRLEKSYFSFF